MEDKIKELEERIRQLEQRPIYPPPQYHIHGPANPIPMPSYAVCACGKIGPHTCVTC